MRFSDEQWLELPLGAICTGFGYGINAEAIDFDGENKYIRITDIDEESSKYISNPPVSPAITDSKCIVKENDILFARTGASTGKSYLYNWQDGLLYYAGFLIRANVKKSYNAYFVYQQTKTNKYNNWVRIMSARSGQPGINAQEFSQYKISFPSLPQQNKIASFLSKVDQRIETQSKIIDKLKSQMNYIIDNIIDYSAPQFQFKDLYINAGEGGTPSTSNNLYYENGSIPFIKIEDLSNKYLNENKDFITEQGLKNSSAWIIPANSIIYSNGATIGRISINTYPVCTKQGILGIIPSRIVLTEYLYYFLRSVYFRKQVHRITVKGTMDCAYLKDLNFIKCYIPALERQEKIIKSLRCLDEKILLEETILNKLKEQKKFLLSNMFI